MATLLSGLLLSCLQIPLIVGQCVINDDEGNVVATQLEGHWVGSVEVSNMLGGYIFRENVWITRDDSVLDMMGDLCLSLGDHWVGSVEVSNMLGGYIFREN